MALPGSGAISLSQVNTELGLAATTAISLNQTNVRNLAGVASGAISMSNLHGKSAYISGSRLVAGYKGAAYGYSTFETPVMGSLTPANINGIAVKYVASYLGDFEVDLVTRYQRLPGTYLRIKNSSGAVLIDLPLTGKVQVNDDFGTYYYWTGIGFAFANGGTYYLECV